MQSLGDSQLADLLQPYLNGCDIPPDLYAKLRMYLDLLLRWNTRTNLTAVRDPAQLVQRQVGESLFAARFLGVAASLLDVGSGAGFPGIPLSLMRPGLRVVLTESQGKKSSFLLEAVRLLQIDVTVWPGRVEAMDDKLQFDVVAMRAVDKTDAVLEAAMRRVSPEGFLLRYVSQQEDVTHPDWEVAEARAIPLSSGRLVLLRRSSTSV